MPVAYQTAFRALAKAANGVGGDTVLIHGASGAVGLAAIQMARILGARRIVGTSSSEEGRRMVLEQVCKSFVNP
jgi:NADPH2:quinone reductase